MIITLPPSMKYKIEEDDCLGGGALERKLIINVIPYVIYIAPYINFHSTLKYKRLFVYHRMMSKKKTSGEKSLGHRSEKPPPYT